MPILSICCLRLVSFWVPRFLFWWPHLLRRHSRCCRDLDSLVTVEYYCKLCALLDEHDPDENERCQGYQQQGIDVQTVVKYRLATKALLSFNSTTSQFLSVEESHDNEACVIQLQSTFL